MYIATPRTLLLCLVLLLAALTARAGCDAPLALQVLGSGGPQAADGRRAGTAYLVWIQGRARLLIDAGGGTLTRFGAAGARFEDLDLIALTHLHADHAAELEAAGHKRKEQPS